MERSPGSTAPSDLVGVRAIRADDVEGFRELRLEALRTHPTAFGSSYEVEAARPPEWWVERVRGNATGEDGTIFLAEAQGTLAGIIGIHRHPRPKLRHGATITSVYVRAEWRGQRLGDRLVAACLAWAATRGLRSVKLSVVATNVGAIRCYLRCGFSIYGVDPEVIFHDGAYYDELLMVHRLAISGEE